MPDARDDIFFMRRALRLAARGRGRVEPNPMVGCVIARHGRILGEGYHRKFGGPHAEIDALRRCELNTRAATFYVTLEPCCVTGKTPPCTDALIAAGPRRVVAAVRDPNPRIRGRGLRALRRAGIRVEVGVLAREAADLIAPYAKLTRHKRPWVILKWAQSIDGRIATRCGDARWISDKDMRAHAQRTRADLDAIIVGSGTVLADDPALTCRIIRPRRVATRVVLDSRLRTPARARLVRTARKVPTWVFCGGGAPRVRARALEQAGCVIHRVPTDDGNLSLAAVLDVLGQRDMTNVLVEGGGRLLGRFFDQRLADELHVYIAPLLIGGRDAVGALDGLGSARIREALSLEQPGPMRRIGSGWLLQTRLHSRSG